jgi:carboxyl-terminal processing protease
MDLIEQVYVEKTDRQKLYQAAMTGMVESLDRYSSYIPPDDFTQFQDIITQEFGGLGIIIDGPPQTEKLVIVTPLFGTPAYEAGLEPGDVIVSIDGKTTQGMEISQVSQLLRGPEGSSVKLEIAREGQPENIPFEVKRAAIELESVVGDRRNRDARWSYSLQSDPEIAYFRINTFGEKTVNELRAALETVKPSMKACIIDLRDNAGGLLTSAADICDMFLNDGTIVSTKGRDGLLYEEIKATSGTEIPDSIPMVVIINDESASASEVVAGCLQDRKRAVIVGQRSFGKGSVQNVIELDSGRAGLKLTTAKYYPPSGRNIHRTAESKPEDVWGVMPDAGLEVSLDDNQRRAVFQHWRDRSDPRKSQGEGQPTSQSESTPSPSENASTNSAYADPQLQKAIEYLKSKLEKTDQ